MDIYIYQLLLVAGIHALAVISPGPDFILVTKYSIAHSRKIGIGAALGIALGISVHVVYSLLGLGVLISSSVLLFNTIKIAGALYLIYIGIMSFRSSKAKTLGIDKLEVKKISFVQSIKDGFLTNVLNPKATLFFVAVFTQIITPETPRWIQMMYGTEMMIATAAWFSIVALCFSAEYFSKKIQAMKCVLDKVTGAVLTALGVKILLE